MKRLVRGLRLAKSPFAFSYAYKERRTMRIIKQILVLLFFFTLVACGQVNESNAPQNNPEPTISLKDQKILIAYFAVAENSEVDAISSASVVTINQEAKGKTRALADMIQRHTQGDVFSIQTSVSYSGNIDALIDYAAQEQDDEARPALTSYIDHLNEYDVIFIGYPNWWYDMPMVMYSFFEAYDFSGKTIIPFNTHNGSRFSNTIETIQELEPNANIVENGFTVNEDDVLDADADVEAWLHTFDL